MRRVLAALCAALTTAALATACSHVPSTPHGTVAAKDHEPSRTTWTVGTRYRRVCSTTPRRSGKRTGTSRSCRNVPNGTRRIYHHSPECWGIDLASGEHLCVTAARWLKTRVGDHI